LEDGLPVLKKKGLAGRTRTGLIPEGFPSQAGFSVVTEHSICLFTSFTRYSMRSQFLAYRSSWIHYLLAGNGKRLLLCMHGYGESADSFAFLEKDLPPAYSMLAIDFPYHGQTVWKDGPYFTPDNLLEIIHAIGREQGIAIENISLMGFSMGGRMVLHMLQLLADKTNRLLLLAPDGLRVNTWYWLATQTRIGKSFFKYTMHHPGWFFATIRVAKTLKLANPSVYKFVNYYIEDEWMREELYLRWTSMCRFKPDLGKIRTLIRRHEIQVRMLYGRYDRIIRFERGEKFSRGIEALCTLKILPCGHQLLQEKNGEMISNMLSD